MDKLHVGVLGATSSVGECLLPLLAQSNFQVTAFTRQEPRQTTAEVTWKQLSPASVTETSGYIPTWICVAPIWVLLDHFETLKAYGVRRLVILSSTSRFTKEGSSAPEEQATALRLRDAESKVQEWSERHNVEWVILRPTLIYGLGRDKNIAEIARVIRRFGLFPIFGKAQGLRQPVHVSDVAWACHAAMNSPAATNRAYNISGGETLSYREMVKRVFTPLGRPVFLLPVPLLAFRLATMVLRLLPRYRNWTVAMAERMNNDLVFEHGDASRDFGFKPRSFVSAP